MSIPNKRWTVEYHRDIEKELRQLPKPFIARIVEKIESLGDNPRPHGCEKVRGHELWKVRVGVYRILYTINEEQHIVHVYRIGHRRDIYRDLQ
jgi:mRNA interferase RelE/StbE